MTTTPAKSRQQNVTQFIKTMLLLSALLLTLSGQSFAAPASQIGSNSDAQKLKVENEAKAIAEYRLVLNKVVKGQVWDSLDVSKLKGLRCVVGVKISRDGAMNVINKDGDAVLCNKVAEAILDIKKAPAPSQKVLQSFAFKNGFATINFHFDFSFLH